MNGPELLDQGLAVFGPVILQAVLGRPPEVAQRQGLRGPDVIVIHELFRRLWPRVLARILVQRFGLESTALCLGQHPATIELWCAGEAFPDYKTFVAMEEARFCAWCGGAQSSALDGDDPVCAECAPLPAAPAGPEKRRAAPKPVAALSSADALRLALVRSGSTVPFELVLGRVKRGWSTEAAVNTPKLSVGGQPRPAKAASR